MQTKFAEKRSSRFTKRQEEETGFAIDQSQKAPKAIAYPQRKPTSVGFQGEVENVELSSWMRWKSREASNVLSGRV